MKPFAADFGMHGVVLTGAKHRLMAALVAGTQRIPSHLVNKFWIRPVIQLGLRLAHVPAEQAKDLSQRYSRFMARSIDAQCDALVVEPFGKKFAGMLRAGFREDLVQENVDIVTAAIKAVEEARSK